jgi:hypothetical protein
MKDPNGRTERRTGTWDRVKGAMRRDWAQVKAALLRNRNGVGAASGFSLEEEAEWEELLELKLNHEPSGGSRSPPASVDSKEGSNPSDQVARISGLAGSRSAAS